MSDTVYVVEKGCYEDRYVAGVYATPEAAMAAHPIPDSLTARDINRPGGWQPSGSGWSNGLDWHHAAHVEPYEVKS